MAKKKGWANAFTSLFVEIEGESSSSEPPEVDIDALLRDTKGLAQEIEASPTSPPPIEAPPPVREAPPATGITMGQPLHQIFSTYNVPSSPKTVEEISAFLTGLKGMPETVQQQALKAMDDADPNWTLADVVLDGRYKVEALKKAKGAIDQQVIEAQSAAALEIADQETYLTEARTTIGGQIAALKEQITELEQLLVAEEAQVTERKSAASAHANTVQQAAAEEHNRLDKEIASITTIVNVFGPLAQES